MERNNTWEAASVGLAVDEGLLIFYLGWTEIGSSIRQLCIKIWMKWGREPCGYTGEKHSRQKEQEAPRLYPVNSWSTGRRCGWRARWGGRKWVETDREAMKRRHNVGSQRVLALLWVRWESFGQFWMEVRLLALASVGSLGFWIENRS